MNLIKEKGKHADTVNRQGMVGGGIRKWKRRVWGPMILSPEGDLMHRYEDP